MGCTIDFSIPPIKMELMKSLQYRELGQILKDYRNRTDGGGIKVIGKKLGTDYTYISKIENGIVRPSERILDSLIKLYQVPVSEAARLYALAGFSGRGVNITMESGNLPVANNPYQNINVSIPDNQQVLYAGTIHIDVSPFGVVLSFAQQVGMTNQFVVVSRVGMSIEHSKVLAEKLLELLTQKQGTSETKNESQKAEKAK